MSEMKNALYDISNKILQRKRLKLKVQQQELPENQTENYVSKK